MKHTLFIFSWLAMMTASAQHPRTITLRVLTYNIYHGEAADGSINMDLLASIINEVNPDLVALQEVDKNTQRTGVIDMTAELSQRTGLRGYFVKHRDYQGGEYGNAILSRFPVAEVDALEGYHSTPSVITFAFATITPAPGVEVVFSSAHLSTRIEDRREQARQLMDYYTIEKDRAPMILTGDLNAEPHHDEIKMLLAEFAEADTTYANTYSARTGPQKKIDFILYPRTGVWEVQETQVLCRPEASDHCAVFAVLKYTVHGEGR